MLQDVFTNLFIHADIKTACNLRMLSKQTLSYCDKYVLMSKLKYETLFESFQSWLKIYHDDYAKQYTSKFFSNKAKWNTSKYHNNQALYNDDQAKYYDDCIINAQDMIMHQKNKGTDIYVRVSIKNHLIYKLLNIDRSNYNTITFHTKLNKISFRMLKLSALTQTLYPDYDYCITVTDNAFLHYLTVLIYDGQYDKIIDMYQWYLISSKS
jgi:hypothetical protein